MEHPNGALLRRVYEAFGRGDMDELMGTFSEDILWHEAGRNPLSGHYKGKDEVLAHLGKIMELSGGTFRIDVHDILASDEHVVVLAREHAERQGKRHPGNTAHLWHVRGGNVTEFWFLPEDQHAIDDFWN